MPRQTSGFTLVEMAIVVLIVGSLVALIVQGQELIRSARVRSLTAQQSAVSTAVFGFQDRYRALPGDYAQASANLICTPTCINGNGNGLIEDVGATREYILVWTHLSSAGFLNASFSATSGTAAPSPGNTPTNPYGAYLQILYDANWGYSGNTAPRHTIKTGNQIPVEILTEIDNKTDDGLPTSGRFQFSPYAGSAPAPDWGVPTRRARTTISPTPARIGTLPTARATAGLPHCCSANQRYQPEARGSQSSLHHT